MDRFIDYMITKRGMADALRVLIASGGDPFAQSRGRLLGAITCCWRGRRSRDDPG